MNNILFAITYHNQKRSSVWKTLRSAASTWADTAVFCYDRSCHGIWFEKNSIITGEETLGGKRNAAIKYARANNYNLIAFLDDDDLFGPSWAKALARLKPEPKTIYHPQYNVMFTPDSYKLHEHVGSDDRCFDSRDFMNFNLWSALCAFDPMAVDIEYRKHKATDTRESFEDWSFNLDTYTAGYTHKVIPDTFHFLRLRQRSLGKSTHTCGPAHSTYFLNQELRDKHHAEKEHPIGEMVIDATKIEAEFKAIHEIEPQLYYWGQKTLSGIRFESERYGRCGKVSDAIGSTGITGDTADIFWTFDPKRIGGAEKAIGFAHRFMARFPLGQIPNQAFISDEEANKSGVDAGMWWSAWLMVLKAWHDAPGSKARSLHICNTVAGWNVIARNPEIFNRVQVYLYVFNDDLRFSDDSKDEITQGYHSPLYRYCELIDRPNFHIITDSEHFAKRIAEKTGLGDRVRILDIPVVPQGNKRKEKSDGKIDILWAGRMDHGKGADIVCEVSRLLPDKYTIHAWSDGKFDGKIIEYGPYKSFEYITGKYDFMWFTSEREGMPNVVKEALSAGLPVLARGEDWVEELPGVSSYPLEYDKEKISNLIQKYDPISLVPDPDRFSFENALPRAMFAYRGCLV